MGLRGRKGCNMSKWKKGLAVTAATVSLASGLVACSTATTTDAAKPAKHETSQQSPEKELRDEQKANPEEEFDVTPEMIVDVMIANSPKQMKSFCKAYGLVGDAGFPAFHSTYGDGPPSARAVFKEAITRC
jgi:hypothetical protein